jgi:hypothetical protein
MNQTADRAEASLARISRCAHSAPIVAAHGNLIASVLGRIDRSYGIENWRSMKNPHIFCLHMDNHRPARFEDLG